MLIGIDGNEANVRNRVGIGEYAFRLIHELSKIKKENLKFQIFLKDQPLIDMPVASENLRYKIIKPKKLWTQFALPLNLYFSGKKPDVFFTPSHYSPRFSPIPTVISIMDLSYIHYPYLFTKHDLYQLINWTKYSVKKASRIFTISQASRDDIIKVYGLPSDKVVVTYPGVRREIASKTRILDMEDLEKKYGISEKYILFVGTLQPRKNLVHLIEAFSGVVKNHPRLKLVIVGKKGWLYEDILKAPVKFGIEDSVKFLDFVSDEDLPSLYENATCFVLPSLYEGFGLPVLEAMKYGCPVLISDVSSLPEAGGDAAIYFDPESIDDMVKKIERVLSDSKLREKMAEKGLEQVKKFSWEKTARETLKVLEEVASK